MWIYQNTADILPIWARSRLIRACEAVNKPLALPLKHAKITPESSPTSPRGTSIRQGDTLLFIESRPLPEGERALFALCTVDSVSGTDVIVDVNDVYYNCQ